jgi:hypothetical protein
MRKVKPKAKSRSVALAASLWHITAQLDRETSERAGAGGTFQVVKLEDDEGNNLTSWVDQGTHFHDLGRGKAGHCQRVRLAADSHRELARSACEWSSSRNR